MKGPRIQLREFLLREARGRATNPCEIHRRHQRIERGHRLHRIGGAEPRQKRAYGNRLDTALTQVGNRERARALAEAATRRIDQQRQVREGRHGGIERRNIWICAAELVT